MRCGGFAPSAALVRIAPWRQPRAIGPPPRRPEGAVFRRSAQIRRGACEVPRRDLRLLAGLTRLGADAPGATSCARPCSSLLRATSTSPSSATVVAGIAGRPRRSIRSLSSYIWRPRSWAIAVRSSVAGVAIARDQRVEMAAAARAMVTMLRRRNAWPPSPRSALNATVRRPSSSCQGSICSSWTRNAPRSRCRVPTRRVGLAA